jgi:hypothetical protein
MVQAPGCTVVERLSHNPEAEGSNPSSGTGMEKGQRQCFPSKLTRL